MRRALLFVVAIAGTASAQPITSPSQVDAPARAKKPAIKKHISKHSQKHARKKIDPRANELAMQLTRHDTTDASPPPIRVVSAPKIREVSAANIKPQKTRDPIGTRGTAPATESITTVASTPATPDRITVEQQSQQLKTVGRVQYTAGSMPPGFAWPPTSNMRAVEQRCEAELADHHVELQRAAPLGKVVDPIVSPAMQFGGIAYHAKWDKPPFVIDCQLGRMLVHLGPKLAQLGVTDVTFGSLYRNTLVRFGGKTGTALSRHALGFAMDITSFKTRDGKDHVVKTDYTAGDAVLLAIEELVDHDRDFRILLTPKNDPISHADHFHLEASVDFR